MNNENILHRIANHLIINSSFIGSIGLYHGKIGIILFFFHYAKYTGNSLYNSFAEELLNEVFSEIYEEIPCNFEYGFCGIGWVIEYLLENRFVEGDSDEILSVIDKKVMERDILRIEDKSLKTGLMGIIIYVNSRLKSNYRKKGILPFDNRYLDCFNKVSKDILIPSDKLILKEIIAPSLAFDYDLDRSNLELESGCTGYGLNQILL